MTRKSMATSGRTRAHRVMTSVRIELAQGGRFLARHCAQAFKSRPHISLAATGLVALGLVFSLVPSGPEGSPAARVQPLELPKFAEEARKGPTTDTSSPAHEAAPADYPEPTTQDWQIVEIRPGQTLERVFRDLGLDAGLLHEIVTTTEQTRNLARIRPGDEFAFDIHPEDGFRALRTELDEDAWLYVERDQDRLLTRTEPRHLERRIVEASGTIDASLYTDAREAGLSDSMIMRLATIFGWDIDFALDIRDGDRFALIYEEVWREGEHLRDGDILAARFINRGESFEAVRYDAGNGPDYFAPDGRPMRKAFLRTPLNFARVSSNFNPRRLHPVTRRVRPHNGTDYAANTGTPVWASGDGTVIEAGYSRPNGNYIFIKHGNNIVTRYLHLSKKLVKRGDRVRQGQSIGHVGSTGLATGPHLHYEFLLNGVHRNPRTVDLPPADPLPAEHMKAFGRLGQGLLARLDNLAPPVTLLAQSDKDCEQLSNSC
ncbi:peptidoglycan DD-metalloendopeptidase family protein [Wenzhouxiangella sp. XN201]|uniref:peptidoglycan DD-metalloendopeptidase family protein n=1 Tax=Wenzhouxiangella sp. XN201 TaxID=2710755 RepID=UPI0013CBADE8|nr:peptidoglycan DD-metalloendopeptidase family protein [Wenzhouxiangella sp. XN201]NEZ04873.1 peptidoglycan DD-metalloendopeptidase family protein [Wenzhouxiangella sp. XN201]